MSIPQAQVLYRRAEDILLGWSQLSKSDAKTYNLYACSTPTGVYVLLKNGIPNVVDKNYKSKVIVFVEDSDVPIPSNTKYYFKVTYVSPFGIESDINLSQYTTVYPAGVAPSFEGEWKEANGHIFGWSDDRLRWEKLLIKEDGKLLVDAEITNSDSKVAALEDDTTLKYLLVDNSRRLVVKQDPTYINRINSYSEMNNIVGGLETTIFTYTNPIVFYIENILCTGTADTLFRLKVSGTTIASLRNNWSNRNINFDFNKSIRCNAGVTVSITAYHSELANQSYATSFFGYLY